MRYYKLLFIFSVLIFFNELVNSQPNYKNNATTISSKKSNFIESLTINKKNINNYLGINNSSPVKRLITNNLILDGISGNEISQKAFRIKVEESLTIKNCNWFDVYKFLNSIDSNSRLESINFENISFAKSKEIVFKYKALKNISFYNCDSLCNENISKNLCTVKKLNRINLNDNSLQAIPNLSYLQVDSLFLNNNPKLKIENELKRLPIKLKYLKTDKPLDINKSDNKKLFSGTIISFDTISNSKNLQLQPKRKHGVFKVSKQDQVLYSGAYTYFASLIQDNPYNISFDTTLFDQRFENLAYKRLVKNNTFVSTYYLKPLSKRFNKKICFQLIDIKRSKKRISQIYSDFPEYNIFKKIIWVLDNPVKKNDFLKLYKKRLWHDYRIKYNDGNNTFTIVFKDDTSFFSIDAKPLSSYNIDRPNKSIENFHKLYLSYEKRLDQRRLRFNNILAKDYTIFKKAKTYFADSCWVIFSNIYLSEEEKKMNKDEWFEYYETIIANEKSILNQSSSNLQILNRALQLIGINENTKAYNTSSSNVRFKLIDSENRILSVNNATIIDLQDLNYMNFLGGLGFNQASLYLKPDSKYVIYAELLGGDIAIVKPEDMTFKAESITSNMLFNATILEKGLNSLEQILSYFGLKL